MKIIGLKSLLFNVPGLSSPRPKLRHGRQLVLLSHTDLTLNLCTFSFILLFLLLVTRPLPRDGCMAENHRAPEAKQLPRVWTTGCKETESRQRVSYAKTLAGHCRMKSEVSWDECPQALQEGFLILPILDINLTKRCVQCSKDESEHSEHDEGTQVPWWKSWEPVCQRI